MTDNEIIDSCMKAIESGHRSVGVLVGSTVRQRSLLDSAYNEGWAVDPLKSLILRPTEDSYIHVVRVDDYLSICGLEFSYLINTIDVLRDFDSIQSAAKTICRPCKGVDKVEYIRG